MAVTFTVPEFITVHLGAPSDTSVANVRVSFPDYIKNVASSEIYPTWPENAIRANIYAQISYTLNRIFTEHYRAQGYPFDITNSTQYDQSFVDGRDIFENISQIVDDIFNDYIVRRGNLEPLFAQYCDGVNTICDGLSQWGTVDLANQGYTPYEILQYYFGDEIDIVFDAPVADFRESYPGYALRLGDSGEPVQRMQIMLNRIGRNYPAIPKIAYPDGLFDVATEDAVREFQRIFNLDVDGVIGKGTWYRVQFLYNTVKRLGELDSEGLLISDVSRQYTTELKEGDSGENVRVVQFYLNFIAEFNNEIPTVAIDGIFGPATAEAVRAFQRSVGLEVDGIVDKETWDKIYEEYLAAFESIPPEYQDRGAVLFPGTSLRLGSSGDDVSTIQEYLNTISTVYPNIPKVGVTGYFGTDTQNAVLAFQREFGLPPRGIVGPFTWERIVDLYTDIRDGNEKSFGQYPGAPVGQQ